MPTLMTCDSCGEQKTTNRSGVCKECRMTTCIFKDCGNKFPETKKFRKFCQEHRSYGQLKNKKRGEASYPPLFEGG